MRLFRLLKKLNWNVYLMELIIVILGISIAYQLNIVYEGRVNHKLELTALENLKRENEINIAEFQSLATYRVNITETTGKLLKLLKSQQDISADSAKKYVIPLIRTSTPDLQQEASNFYLNSNYGDANLDLKNELLTLKTYLQELMELSEDYKDRKMNLFMAFLRSAVDFADRRIVDIRKINSLEFKNIIWNQNGDEFELNRLYKQANDQLLLVQHKVDSILNNAQ